MHRIDNLVRQYPDLQSLHQELEKAFRILRDCLLTGGKLLLCGNGGSAADCEHWAGELLKSFVHPRPLPEEDQARLPQELATGLQGALPAIPLTGFPSLATAFGNDADPVLTFAQLTWGLGNPGDVLICLSTSGNSNNILHAARAARAKGMMTLGLTGQSGGKLKTLVDLCLCVPADETHRVQEYHLPIYHCLSLMLEDRFFSTPPPS